MCSSDLAQQEVRGLAATGEVVRLLKPLQTHRSLASAVLNGDRAMVKQRGERAAEVSAQFVKVRAADFPKPVHVELGLTAHGWRVVRVRLPAELLEQTHWKV